MGPRRLSRGQDEHCGKAQKRLLFPEQAAGNPRRAVGLPERVPHESTVTRVTPLILSKPSFSISAVHLVLNGKKKKRLPKVKRHVALLIVYI